REPGLRDEELVCGAREVEFLGDRNEAAEQTGVKVAQVLGHGWTRCHLRVFSRYPGTLFGKCGAHRASNRAIWEYASMADRRRSNMRSRVGLMLRACSDTASLASVPVPRRVPSRMGWWAKGSTNR